MCWTKLKKFEPPSENSSTPWCPKLVMTPPKMVHDPMLETTGFGELSL